MTDNTSERSGLAIDDCHSAFITKFCPYRGSPDPYVVWRAAWQAALATKATEALCLCKDRPADKCTGEWEPGCDLGNNPKFVKAGQFDADLNATVKKLGKPPTEAKEEVVQRIMGLALAWSRASGRSDLDKTFLEFQSALRTALATQAEAVEVLRELSTSLQVMLEPWRHFKDSELTSDGRILRARKAVDRATALAAKGKV